MDGFRVWLPLKNRADEQKMSDFQGNIPWIKMAGCRANPTDSRKLARITPPRDVARDHLLHQYCSFLVPLHSSTVYELPVLGLFQPDTAVLFATMRA
jgi:hypothetical protein